MATPGRSQPNLVDLNKPLPTRPGGGRGLPANLNTTTPLVPLTPSILLGCTSSIPHSNPQAGPSESGSESVQAANNDNTNIASPTSDSSMSNMNSPTGPSGDNSGNSVTITSNDDDDDAAATATSTAGNNDNNVPRPSASRRHAKLRRDPSASIERSLTKRLAMIVYYRDHIPGTEHTRRQNTAIQLNPEVLDLFLVHEPPPRTPEQVTALVKYLETGPGSASEKWKSLHAFVSRLERLRNEWLMSMCDYYGLLAYLEACQVWGVKPISPHSEARGGPQWHGINRMNSDHVDLCTRALERFKSAPTFADNDANMHLARQQMQAEDRERRKRAHEAKIRSEHREQRRNAVKARNAVAVERQLGHGLGGEMSDGQQQGVLEMMERIVAGEIEETTE